MLGQAVQLGRLVIKHGPQILSAVSMIRTFIKANPSLPTWARERLNDIAKRLDGVQKRRGDAAQIRGKLEIVRTEARDLEAEPADRVPASSSTWVQRADDIDRALGLAEQLAKAAQKRTLARLNGQADDLLAEVIDAIAGGRPETPTDKAA